MGVASSGTISGNEFKHVLYEFGLINPMSVFLGNPKQKYTCKMDHVANFVRANYGKKPCYISHNPVFDLAHGRYPQKIYYSKNFIDLDGDPEKGFQKVDALKDHIALSEWLDDFAIPYNATNTGGKGYHTFIRFKPEVYRIDRKLTDKIRAIQMFLGKELGLKTLDIRCAEPRRITRIPLAAYVDKDGKKNNLHCIPMNREMIQGMNVEEIDELARTPLIPDELTMNSEGNYMTLDGFIEEFKIPLEYAGMPMGEGEFSIKDYKVITNLPFLRIMEDIIRRPCVYRELVVEDRPAHIARLDACIVIKKLGFTIDEALAIFDQFAISANWHDQHNAEKRHTNVRSVYLREPGYKQFTCGSLKRAGLCVGEVCPHYYKI